MTLAKLFKGPAADDDITALIHRECVKRTEYSFAEVKERIALLHEYVQQNEVDINMDEFMRLFFSVYMAVYADKPRNKAVFHPSSIESDCERKLYYEFCGFTETDKIRNRIDGRTQMTFDVGTWYHTYIQMLLWKAGVLVQSEAEVKSRRKRLHGHTDGIMKLESGKVLLEIKTMNDYSYSRGKLAPIPHHEVQAGIYATELGIDRICFIYINKNTSDITVHFRDVKQKKVQQMHDKMGDVLHAVNIEKAPKREVCSGYEDGPALKCPFRKLCFNK